MDPIKKPSQGTVGPPTSSRPSSTSTDDEPSEKKPGRLTIINAGGSFTVIIQLAILAFGIRHLRNIIAKRRRATGNDVGDSGPSFAHMTAAALRMLIQLDAAPFQLVDVRSRDEARDKAISFQNLLHIPENELRGALQLPSAAWEHRFGSRRQPDRRNLLILLSSDGQKAEQAARTASLLGFSRCCVLKGGLACLERSDEELAFARVKRISRDALAVLLSRHQTSRNGTTPVPKEAEESSLAPPLLLDVRRHDERTFFGAIPSSKHLPVDQLPIALATDDDTWRKIFRFPKPSKEAPLILQCRTNKRALWAAQLAIDAGYTNCFVYTQGVFGWRLHPSVMAYNSYEEGEAPPEPIPFSVETIDKLGAEKELQMLGIIS